MSRPPLALFALLALAVALSGCGEDRIALVDEGNTYALKETADILATVEPLGDVVNAEDQSAERTRALTALRREGDLGNSAATIITEAFPPGTRGVPFYVEKAKVDGSEAWLVIEAIGPSGKPLTDERLWVLDPSGDVIFSATR